MEIGKRIRSLRERRDWTQKKLSEKTGINQSVFNRIESGERKVRSDELTKIAEALDIKVDYLLGKVDAEGKIYNDKETTSKLIKEEADRIGLSVNDPRFQKLLSDAFDMLRIARGKDNE